MNIYYNKHYPQKNMFIIILIKNIVIRIYPQKIMYILVIILSYSLQSSLPSPWSSTLATESREDTKINIPTNIYVITIKSGQLKLFKQANLVN